MTNKQSNKQIVVCVGIIMATGGAIPSIINELVNPLFPVSLSRFFVRVTLSLFCGLLLLP